MKAQSQVIQFALFFIIGIILFGTIGNFYKIHALITRDRIEKKYLDLLSSYLSGVVINEVEGCKFCNYTNFTVKIPNETASFYNEISLISHPNLMIITSIPYRFEKASSIHKINTTIQLEGTAVSTQKLIFSYIRKENKLILTVGK